MNTTFSLPTDTVIIDGVECAIREIGEIWKKRSDRRNYVLDVDDTTRRQIMAADLEKMARVVLADDGILKPTDALVEQTMIELRTEQRYVPATSVITPSGPGYINRHQSRGNLVVTAMIAGDVETAPVADVQL